MQRSSKTRITPAFFVSVALVLVFWHWLVGMGGETHALFPAPAEVARAFVTELTSGRLLRDVIASLFRVLTGFTLAAVIGIPLGLWAGV